MPRAADGHRDQRGGESDEQAERALRGEHAAPVPAEYGQPPQADRVFGESVCFAHFSFSSRRVALRRVGHSRRDFQLSDTRIRGQPRKVRLDSGWFVALHWPSIWATSGSRVFE